MERPTWATVVGVLGIVVASLMIIGAFPAMAWPAILDMQREMLGAMESAVEQEAVRQGNPEEAASAAEVLGTFRTMLDVPDWLRRWSVVSGILSLCIAAVYLYASIRLLQTKPSGITFFYIAAGLGIALAFVQAAVGLMGGQFLALGIAAGAGLGLVFNVVLLVVVATGNKEAFYQGRGTAPAFPPDSS